MRLSRLVLNCRSPESLAAFYARRLGMRVWYEKNALLVGYEGPGARIELRSASGNTPYRHDATDRYWKIGISVPDLALAHSHLRSAGIVVSDPHMFQDIGLMSHLEDPEGFKIELLQHTFHAAPKTLGHLFSAEVFHTIGQITLRVNDVDKALALYRDQLGMSLLSIQPVPAHGFTLYFLAFTDERPPHKDLTAVDNREWLWRRPYTTLELQSFDSEQEAFAAPEQGAPGYGGLIVGQGRPSAGSLLDDAGGRVYFSDA